MTSPENPPKFREVAKPEPRQIVVPYEERTSPALKLPKLALFAGEFKYWRDAYDQAVESNDEGMKSVGKRLKHEMRYASRSGVAIQVAAERATVVAASFDARTWYNRVTKYLTWSRMWREVGESILHPGEGISAAFLTGWTPHSDELTGFLIEQAPEDSRCGIQVVPGLFRHLFDVEPPENETVWLEGTDVYIEAAHPGVPGEALQRVYQQEGTVFPAAEYVTARPYLKSDVWQTYVEH